MVNWLLLIYTLLALNKFVVPNTDKFPFITVGPLKVEVPEKILFPKLSIILGDFIPTEDVNGALIIRPAPWAISNL